MLKSRKRITKKQIKEDPLVTYYFKTMDFLKTHSQKITIGVIAVFAVIVLLTMMVKSKRTAELNASEQLARATMALSANKSQQAIDILLSLNENYSGTSSATKGIYYLGKAHYQKGEYDKAQIYFEKFAAKSGKDKIFGSAAYLGLGASLEQQGKFLEAARAYQKGADKFPNDFNSDQLLMNAGRCYLKANQIAEARECYQTVVEKFEDSNYKLDAELYLAKLKS